MKIKLAAIFFTCLLSTSFVFAQSTVQLNEVDLLVYDKEDTDNIAFYQDKGNNQFLEVWIEFDEEKKYENGQYVITHTLAYAEKTVPFEELTRDEEDVIVYVKDVKPTSRTSFINQPFEVEEDWVKYNDSTHQVVFEMLSTHLGTIQELYFGEKKRRGGFGVRENDPTHQKHRWRAAWVNYYNVIDIDFGDNKHIYFLCEESDLSYIFLPLEEVTYLISDDKGTSKISPNPSYDISYAERFSQYEPADFTVFTQNEKAQYILKNAFDEPLIPPYDSLRYNSLFIIGKNKNGETHIYDSYYHKANIDPVQSAYFYRNGLEILTAEGASYYNANLEKVDEFPPLSYALCGTVSLIATEISKTKQDYYLTHEVGYAFSNNPTITYRLGGLKKKDSITFLDNSTMHVWDENDDFVNNTFLSPTLLKVIRKGKSGIYRYPFEVGETTPDYYHLSLIEPKIALPIDKDSIVFKDKLVLFYEKEQVGIFPQHQTAPYQYLEKVTNSFFSIKRDDKVGWLDIKTFKEYFND
ncbi:MAG: hypothetical protein ACFB0B_08860 [Thermonemataceae bacterium]